MPLYSASVSMSGINTTGKCYHTLMAGATRRLKVYRISIAMPAASSNVAQLQIRRVTAAGVTPGVTTTPNPLDPNDAATGASLLSGGFGTDPTTSSTPLDMATLPLTAGAAWVWTYNTPIVITNGTANGLTIYNANSSGTTTGTYVASFLYEE